MAANQAHTPFLTTSKITSKGQLTMPKTVRDVLGLGYGDSVRFVVANGIVTVEPATEHEDPAIGAFLAVIANDIALGRNVRSELPADVTTDMRHAMENVNVDLDEDVGGDISL